MCGIVRIAFLDKQASSYITGWIKISPIQRICFSQQIITIQKQLDLLLEMQGKVDIHGRSFKSNYIKRYQLEFFINNHGQSSDAVGFPASPFK